MPGRDNTGPMGMGPKTGRAAGNCVGNAAVGGGGGGRGFGRGGGRGGHGRRNRFHATGLTGWQRAAGISGSDQPTAAGEEQALDVLKRQAEGVANTLEEINKRIAQLETQSREA